MIDAEMDRIASHTELERQTYLFEGERVVPELVLEAISQMHVEADDLIVFYFSGHGFRSFDMESPWPNLLFPFDEAISMEKVGRMLEAHKPRLLILLSDACNNYLPGFLAPKLVAKGVRNIVDEDSVKQNYKRLFLEVRGTIIATAAKAGEISWALKKGSLFTIAFLNQLNHAILSLSPIGWEEIFELTAEQVKFEQHPEYRVYLNALESS